MEQDANDLMLCLDDCTIDDFAENAEAVMLATDNRRTKSLSNLSDPYGENEKSILVLRRAHSKSSIGYENDSTNNVSAPGI